MKDNKEVEIIWPEIGSKWKDDIGRILLVTEVIEVGYERNIVGKVDGVDYATTKQIFDLIWKERL